MTAVLGVIATVYGTAGALSVLFQARQVLLTRGSCEVSLRFLSIYAGGYAVWLAYGAAIHSAALIIADLAGVVCGTATIAVALAFHKSCVPARSKDVLS